MTRLKPEPAISDTIHKDSDHAIPLKDPVDRVPSTLGEQLGMPAANQLTGGSHETGACG